MTDVLCKVVVGRARELELLRAAFEGACGGCGSVAVLLGEAGIGKSRLVRELENDAFSVGARVLRGRAVPGSSAVAFRSLAEALAPTADDLLAAGGALMPWLSSLAGVVPGIGIHGPGQPLESPAARGEAVVRALQTLCVGGGLLVLEDLHWADPETLALVEQLADSIRRAPVLCVVTVRSEEPSAGRDLARTLADRRSATVIALPRLNDAQVAAMVHECTNGAGVGDLDRILTTAEGVPFLVEELLASPGIPTSFAEAVQRRLDDLTTHDRAVLVTAAVLGRDFD